MKYSPVDMKTMAQFILLSCEYVDPKPNTKHAAL